MTCTLFTATRPPLSSCPPTWHARGEGGGREIRSGILTLVYAPIAAYAIGARKGRHIRDYFITSDIGLRVGIVFTSNV